MASKTKLRANQIQIEEVLNHPSAIASTTKAGTLRIATQPEVDAGTATDLAVTPATLSGALASRNWLYANDGDDFSVAPQTSGTDAITIGNNSISYLQAIAIGGGVTAQQNSVSIGLSSNASGLSAVALGHLAQANSNYQVSIGYNMPAGSPEYSVRIGYAQADANLNYLRLRNKGQFEIFGSQAQFVLPNYSSGGSPALPTDTIEGALVYDSATKELRLHNGVSWTAISGLFAEDASRNIVGGTGAGASLTSGTDNFIGGYAAGDAIDTGGRNVILGNYAGTFLTSGVDNVIIGHKAVDDNDTASTDRQTIIGAYAGGNVSGGDPAGNIILGFRAGRGAGLNGGTGGGNFFAGYEAANVWQAAHDNIAIGESALNIIVNGSANVALGKNAGSKIVSSVNNLLIGQSAGRNITGSQNVFIGSNAGFRVTTGDRNHGFGRQSLQQITVGTDNIGIGYKAGPTTDQSNQLFINNNESDTPLIHGSFATAVGSPLVDAAVTIHGELKISNRVTIPIDDAISVAGVVNYETLVTNDDDIPNKKYVDDAITIGGGAATLDALLDVTLTGSPTPQAGDVLTYSGTGSPVQWVHAPAVKVIASDDNIIGGIGAGASVTPGQTTRNIMLGTDAGNQLTSTSSRNIFIGNHAGDTATSSGNLSIAIGQYALRNGPSGTVAIGAYAGRYGSSTAINSVIVGRNAGRGGGTLSGSTNVLIGYGAGQNMSTGNRNILIGEKPGVAMTSGTYNIAIGRFALAKNPTTGDWNTVVGQNAGYAIQSGDNNVVIGRGAGPTSAQSNQLYIDSLSGFSGNDNPLIHGHFTNDTVTINGQLNVSTTTTLGSPTIQSEVRLHDTVNNAVTIITNAPLTGSPTGDTRFQLPADNGQAGRFLQTDGSGNTSWQVAAGSISVLNDLTDVTLGSPVDNQVLTYSGGAWINQTPSVGTTYAIDESGRNETGNWLEFTDSGASDRLHFSSNDAATNLWRGSSSEGYHFQMSNNNSSITIDRPNNEGSRILGYNFVSGGDEGLVIDALSGSAAKSTLRLKANGVETIKIKNGSLFFPNLPTSDPAVTGEFWLDNGLLVESGSTAPTSVSILNDLSDVDTTGASPPLTSGDVLTYAGSPTGWIHQTPVAVITDHLLLSNIGTNTHAQIDTHISDSSIHFTKASIEIGDLGNVNIVGSPALAVDDLLVYAGSPSGWVNIPKTDVGVTDHTSLTNIGTNTHAQIDTAITNSVNHIADATLHRVIQDGSPTSTTLYSGSKIETELATKLADITTESIGDLSDVTLTGSPALAVDDVLVFDGAAWVHAPKTTVGVLDHTLLTNIGTNTHAQIDTHISDSSIHFSTLDGLTDVALGSPVDNQVLTYSGGIWTNQAPVPSYNWLAANIGADFAIAPVASANQTIALGNNASATFTNGMAIGTNASSSGGDGMALGFGATAFQASTCAVGEGAAATITNAIALGVNSAASGSAAVCLGSGASSDENNGIAIGTNAQCDGGGNNVVIGPTASISSGAGTNCVVIGASSSAGYGDFKAVVIGSSSETTETHQIAIGSDLDATVVTSDVAYSVKMGNGATGINKNLLHLFSKGKLELYGDEAQFIIPNYQGSPAGVPANAIEGGLIYDTVAKGLQVYGGSPTGWQAVGGGAATLNELTDVTITGSPAAVNGEVLKFNGTNWINSADVGEVNTNWIYANGGADFGTAPVAGGTAQGNIAIGDSADAGSTFYSIAIGQLAECTTHSSVALGRGASVTTGLYGISVGNSTVTGTDGIAIGRNSTATANQSVAVGFSPDATAADTIAIGSSSTAGHALSSVIGKLNTTSQTGQVIIGNNLSSATTTTDNIYSIKIGQGTGTYKNMIHVDDRGHFELYGTRAQIVVPKYPTSSEPATPREGSLIYDSTLGVLKTYDGGSPNGWNVVGGSSVASLNDLTDVALGSPVDNQVLTYSGGAWTNQTPAPSYNWLTANNSTDFGTAPSAASNSIAIGSGATASANYTICIGRVTSATVSSSIAIGDNADSTAQGAIAIGENSNSNGQQAVTVGRASTSSLAQQVTVGVDITSADVNSDVAYSAKIGYGTGVNTNLLHLFSKGKLELYGDEAQFIIPNYAVSAGSPLVALPANPVEGGLVYDSVAKGLQVYGGSPTGWQVVGGGSISPLTANLDTGGYNIVTADNTTNAQAENITIQPGQGDTGYSGGNVVINGGYGGGDISLTAGGYGNGVNDGGNILIKSGQNSTGGGLVTIQNEGGGAKIVFDATSAITITGTTTTTGQIKGITPVVDADLTRKDYVDDKVTGYTAQTGNATNTDLSGNPVQTNTLTTNVSLTTSNRVAGRKVDVFYLASAADRTVTLNASWNSFGEASPIIVPTGKRLVLSLVALGTAETDIQAIAVLEN